MINVNSDPYKEQIEQRTKGLRTALQPQGGITKKGPILRRDPRQLPRLPYDAMRKISEYSWQIDEQFLKALLEETKQEDDRVILSPNFKKLFPGLQILELLKSDEGTGDDQGNWMTLKEGDEQVEEKWAILGDLAVPKSQTLEEYFKTIGVNRSGFSDGSMQYWSSRNSRVRGIVKVFNDVRYPASVYIITDEYVVILKSEGGKILGRYIKNESEIEYSDSE